MLGSITLQNLVALYPSACAGMTGTAATQADEFREIYGLEVAVIPPHRPVVRVDHPDELFASKAEKEAAVVARSAECTRAGGRCWSARRASRSRSA